MKKIFTLLGASIALQLFAQPNCEAFKYFGEDLKYEACMAAEERSGHYQFSREYQEALDNALEIDPTFSYAYRAKSTAYLKAGNFIEWKRLMDKAVKLEPEEYLSYRGWCRFQFFRDYAGAIEDIELLDRLTDYDIGHSVNGYYHLHIARALCYKVLGQPEKGIAIIEEQIADSEHVLGLYDNLHLGVMYFELGQYEKAIEIFKIQELESDLAENRYYKALAHKKLGNIEQYKANVSLAKSKYEQELRLFDPYSPQIDKVYLSDIEAEIALME